MSDNVIVDLGTVRAPNTKTFTGQPRGKDARARLKIQSFDRADVLVDVVVPLDTYSVSPSFILGMFTPSIETLGRKGFLEKYNFSSWPPELHDAVDEAVDRVLSRGNVLAGIV
jgi:hypothetical protein